MSPQKMLAYLNIGHFLDHYFLMIFPLAVLAIERQWKLDYADALALGTPLYVGFALGTLPAGWLGDICKRGHLIAVLFIGSGISCVGIAFAPGPFWLMAGLGGLGLFVSIYHPVGLSLVTGLSDRPGHALAVNGVYGNLGLSAGSTAWRIDPVPSYPQQQNRLRCNPRPSRSDLIGIGLSPWLWSPPCLGG